MLNPDINAEIEFSPLEFSPPEFSPLCEITETSENYRLKCDLPGVKKEQIKVEVENNQLMILAERKKEEKKDKKHVSEMYYGSYSRILALPTSVDESKVDTQFENGVLTVTMPKAASSQVNQVAVH